MTLVSITVNSRVTTGLVTAVVLSQAVTITATCSYTVGRVAS